MKPVFLLLILSFLVSCSSMPVITTTMLPAGQKDLTCPSPFFSEKYQLMHSIEINAAGNVQGAIIGVTVVDPLTRFVSCAIMTAEGMVLFEAESSAEKLIIHRALPPFDSGDVAKNLIDDIKLIYFNPQGVLQKKGNLPDGSTACRWQEKNGNFIDVTEGKPGITEIKKYSECGSLKRSVKLTRMAGNPYSIVELQGSEIVDYTLLMTLVEAWSAKSKMPGKKSEGKKSNGKFR